MTEAGFEPAPEPAAPPPGAEPSVRRRPWRWLAVAAVLLAVVVPTAVVVLDRASPRRVQLALPEPDRLVGPDGQELASLLARGRQRTFHATYQLTASERRETLEWWSRDGRTRQDTVMDTEGGAARTAAFHLGERKATACRQEPGQAWTCERVAAPGEGDPRALVASLQAQLSGRAVAVRPDRLDGRQARCFSVAATEGSEAFEVCSDPEGVLLRLTSADSTLQLTALDTSVPDAIFTPPAP